MGRVTVALDWNIAVSQLSFYMSYSQIPVSKFNVNYLYLKKSSVPRKFILRFQYFEVTN